MEPASFRWFYARVCVLNLFFGGFGDTGFSFSLFQFYLPKQAQSKQKKNAAVEAI